MSIQYEGRKRDADVYKTCAELGNAFEAAGLSIQATDLDESRRLQVSNGVDCVQIDLSSSFAVHSNNPNHLESKVIWATVTQSNRTLYPAFKVKNFPNKTRAVKAEMQGEDNNVGQLVTLVTSRLTHGRLCLDSHLG